MTRRLTAAAFTGIAHIALITPVMAQDAASTTESSDSDIVVTASRQGSQSLIDTPLAIQAFSGEQLEERGVADTLGPVIKTFSLRGVGAAGGIGDSPIGYYIDDVPFAIPNSPIAPPLRFIDIDRIEVLRGPQGTLYGQGSAGGTIIYHTREPDLDNFEMRGEATIAKMDDASALNYGVSAAISVPLIKDRLAIRISGGYDKRAGYVDIFRIIRRASTSLSLPSSGSAEPRADMRTGISISTACRSNMTPAPRSSAVRPAISMPNMAI